MSNNLYVITGPPSSGKARIVIDRAIQKGITMEELRKDEGGKKVTQKENCFYGSCYS
jgi:hypothetical protein